MKGIKIVSAIAAMTLSGTAIAENPAWTYVDLGYVVGDSSEKNAETEGGSLRGSFGFADIWHVQADVVLGETNGGKGQINLLSEEGSDTTVYGIRGGIHPSVTENTDFVLDLGYTYIEQKFGFGTNFTDTKVETDAIDIRTGVRSNLGPVELRAFISLGYFDGDSSVVEGRNVSYLVGGQYNFSPAWAVGADATVSDSDDIVNIYVRWSFPNR